MTGRGVVKFLGRMAAVNAAISLAIIVAFNDVTWDTPWRDALEKFIVSYLFAWCIAPLCFAVMPRLSAVLFCRLRFPWSWIFIVAIMVGFATLGSMLALAILTGIGYIHSTQFLQGLAGSLKVSIIVTIGVGVFFNATGMLQSRLHEATLALRTKERDEAEARRIAAEAELASLESRVQPHFLFNTLNSIASLIPTDPAGAERMTGQLASLMRSALDAGATPLVPLEQELNTVRDYLDIEHVRFGDRLRFCVEAADGVKSALVPRLSLQTLAENAVKYAVSPRREGGMIAVRASENGNNRVRLEVEDNGGGFDATALPEYHGLALLKARLALTFGDRATFAIQSAPGRTVVAIEVPRSV